MASTFRLATRIKIFVGIILTTPAALFIGLASTGFGHGDYVLASILFPYTSYYWRSNGCSVTDTHLIDFFLFLCLFQIPIYGGLIILSGKKYVMLFVAIGIIIVHSFVAYLCFQHPIP